MSQTYIRFIPGSIWNLRKTEIWAHQFDLPFGLISVHHGQSRHAPWPDWSGWVSRVAMLIVWFRFHILGACGQTIQAFLYERYLLQSVLKDKNFGGNRMELWMFESLRCMIENRSHVIFTTNIQEMLSRIKCPINLRTLLSDVWPYPNPAKVLGCIHSVTLGANPFRRTTAGTGGSWLGQELQVHSFHV